MLTTSETRLLHALKSRSGREKHRAFLVEGVRVVEELVGSALDLKFAVAAPSLEDSRRGRALAEFLAANTLVRNVREAELKALADTETPQGVIAVAGMPQRGLADIEFAARALVLVLDAVQDPGNLGALIRSADAFGAAGVVALPGTVDFWNPKVVRAAAGSAFRGCLVNESAEPVWQWLAAHDVTVCGADVRGTGVTAARIGARAALVVGNEGGGLRKETRAHVSSMLAIPMTGRAESLNVAVAAGILLYELSRPNR